MKLAPLTYFATENLPVPDATSVFCGALIALPFIFPIAAGPSVNVWQQLASWLCVALLFLLTKARFEFVNPWVIAWLALIALLVAASPDTGFCFSTRAPVIIAVLATAMAACVGSSLTRRGARWPILFAKALLGAGLISAVLGLLQYYGLAEHLEPWTTSPAVGQAFGNLRQRNQFASLISMALIAALWLHATRQSAGSAKRGLASLAVVGLLVAAVAASTSRTGLLEFLLIVGAAAWMARIERRSETGPVASYRLPAPLALLSLIPLYFAAAWVLPRLVGGGTESIVQRLSEGAPAGHSRLILWHNVLNLIAEHPWRGWGWGELSFAHYMHSGLYAGARFVEILDNAHNLPLHLAVELGIPAAVLVCGSFIWLVIAAQPWRERDPFRLMAWGMMGVIVLHSLLEYPLWYGPFQIVFGLCLGVLWPARRAAADRPRHGAHVISSLAVTVLIAIVGYASWDYIRISQVYLPREERLPRYEDHPLDKAQGSWLFANHVDFAKLTLTPLTISNAAEIHVLASRLVHFSPEPRVIVKLIESAELMGLREKAKTEAQRFSVAFPLQYRRWIEGKSVDSSAV
ncbi:O-antigen ligase family protein [uncultured Variovorax sp.]|uniref:PglL family O-oligosaccharyltransferase n=1 Tax=uncultured Variovorax sp. TaxID=114708 RepID=UPI0025FC756E|nr:O-antigen ligase family protein [uncultured Variovorax sp.]